MNRRPRNRNLDVHRRQRAVALRIGKLQGDAMQISVLLDGMLRLSAEAMSDLHEGMGALETELAALRRLDPSAPASIDEALGPNVVHLVRRIELLAAALADTAGTDPSTPPVTPLALVTGGDHGTTSHRESTR